jgi:DNA-binding PadR family transcriptional regulator
MTERAFLGEFEHLVLATALRLKDGYGAELVRDLEERTGRQVQGGALYVTLDRLERKGYLVSRMGDPDPKRGGRPKRFVEVTPEGVRALAEHRDALLRVWEGLESTLGDA